MTLADAPTFDPFADGFDEDPYPQYRQLREAGPVAPTDLGTVLLTRWADVSELLRSRTTSVEDRNAAEGALAMKPVGHTAAHAERGSQAILRLDPPDHTRLRKLVSRAFTPRTIERLRPRVQGMVDTLLDGLSEQEGPVDLISELAFPLPFAVINEMLGMPPGNADEMRDLSHIVSESVDPLLALSNLDAIFEASDAMRALVAEAVAWKRGRPDDDDLLNALLIADDDGDVLTDDEVYDNVVLLYIAGHETTVNLIGNATFALLRNRPQLERLQQGTVEDAGAVEELLRYDSPVQFTRRILLEPVEIGGHAIDPGESVMVGLGAANHDPTKFGTDADELDLSRANAREHVSFGNGVHHCLGAALARLEGQTVLGSMARRFPDIELGGEPSWNGRMILRGMDHLPVSLDR
jgi:cytochrome P450